MNQNSLNKEREMVAGLKELCEQYLELNTTYDLDGADIGEDLQRFETAIGYLDAFALLIPEWEAVVDSHFADVNWRAEERDRALV